MRGPAGFGAGSQGPGGGGAPAAAAAGGAGGQQQQQQQALGACPTCGGLLMLQGGASGAGSGPSSVVCEDGVCSYRLGLPHAVASVCVSGEQCQRCRHGQVMKAALRFRMALLPPGAHACLNPFWLTGSSVTPALAVLHRCKQARQAKIHAAGQQQPGWHASCCLECRHATMLTCPLDCICQVTSSIGCTAISHARQHLCGATHRTYMTMCAVTVRFASVQVCSTNRTTQAAWCVIRPCRSCCKCQGHSPTGPGLQQQPLQVYRPVQAQPAAATHQQAAGSSSSSSIVSRHMGSSGSSSPRKYSRRSSITMELFHAP
jgi:hypothetical protein